MSDLHQSFRRDRARPRAALFVKKIHDFAKRLRIGAIPQVRSFPPNGDESYLLELFEVMGKGGGRYAQFFLYFASDHSGWVRREKQTQDLQTGLGAKSREALSGATDESGIEFHASIIAEIWKKSSCYSFTGSFMRS
jgi:hypothetical protein